MSSYDQQLAIEVAINAIATLGFYVTMSTGQLSITHGAFYALGAYAGGWLMIHAHVPLLVAVLAAFGAGAIVSVLVFPAIRLRGLYFAVATFAFGTAVASGILFINAFGGAFGLTGIPLSTTLELTVIVFVIVFIAVQLMDHSQLYLALTAVRDDPEVAAALGLKVAHLQRLTLVLGAGLAGAAGALYGSSIGVITPDLAGFNQSLTFLLMAVIGGSRTSWGAVLGAVIWTVAPQALSALNDPDKQMILFGILAILVMSFRPQGVIDRGDFARVFRFTRNHLGGSGPTSGPGTPIVASDQPATVGTASEGS